MEQFIAGQAHACPEAAQAAVAATRNCLLSMVSLKIDSGVATSFDAELFKVLEQQKAAFDLDVFGIGVVLSGSETVDEVKHRLVGGGDAEIAHDASVPVCSDAPFNGATFIVENTLM